MARRVIAGPPPPRNQRKNVWGCTLALILFVAWYYFHPGFENDILSLDDEFGAEVSPRGARTVVTFGEARANASLLDGGVCLRDGASVRAAHCLPSLVCIGAMKAGTFELKTWLEEHPKFR